MYIWGDKTVSLFDVWSIEHFISGITIGSLLILIFNKFKLQNRSDYKLLYYVTIFFLAYLWEVVEHYLEDGVMNEAVTYWFQGVEFWGNRIFTDPLLVALGAYVGLKYNFLSRYAQCFSAIWLGVHVFIFPHCMYLQHLIFN